MCSTIVPNLNMLCKFTTVHLKQTYSPYLLNKFTAEGNCGLLQLSWPHLRSLVRRRKAGCLVHAVTCVTSTVFLHATENGVDLGMRLQLPHTTSSTSLYWCVCA